MPICLECGVDNAKNVKYCENCGARMSGINADSSVHSQTMPTMVAEGHRWQLGGWTDAIRTFYLRPKDAKALFEDRNAPNAVILFGIGLSIAILHGMAITSKTVTRSYLNGELVSEGTGNIAFATLGVALQWVLGTALLAVLISSGLHFQSYLKHNENPFTIAVKLNGLRSIPNIVYLIVASIVALVYPERVVETYSDSTSLISLLAPDIKVVSGPPKEIDILLLLLQMIAFVISYVVLYRGMAQTLELRGWLYKIIIGLYFFLTLLNFIGSFVFLF